MPLRNHSGGRPKSSHPLKNDNYFIGIESMQDNMATPLDPLIALGSFFTINSITIDNHIHKDHPIVKYLSIFALFQQQMDSINKDLSKLIDLHLQEYDGLVAHASELNQPVLEEAIKKANSRTLTMKRKYEETFTAEPSSSKESTVEPIIIHI
ncbi:hypothetical protein BDB01DRAFT_898092 [Pilobolus umbonatus]|nr:hypothetical protein BDB01DRAFT_898092 [Pilobolus umbonatus]